MALATDRLLAALKAHPWRSDDMWSGCANHDCLWEPADIDGDYWEQYLEHACEVAERTPLVGECGRSEGV